MLTAQVLSPEIAREWGPRGPNKTGARRGPALAGRHEQTRHLYVATYGRR